MRNLSCNTVCYNRLPQAMKPELDKAVVSILDAGFDGVDITMYGAKPGFDAVEEVRKEELLRIRAIVEDRRAFISSIQIGKLDLSKLGGAIERVTKAAQHCEVLHTSKMVCSMSMETMKPFQVVEAMSELFEAVKSALVRKNVWLGLENHSDEIYWVQRTTEDMMVAAHLIEKLGLREYVGLAPDSSHFFRAFSDPAEAFAKCMPYSKLLHLQDATEKSFMGAGKGKVNFDAIFKQVRDVGYNGGLSFELQTEDRDVQPELKRSNAFFRELMDKHSIGQSD